MNFFVGTFNHSSIYSLRFLPANSISGAELTVIRDNPAIGPHSWLSLSRDGRFLYATAWTKPKPSIAAYRVEGGSRSLSFLNAKHVKNLSGYVVSDSQYVYSVGGASGEIFMIESDGSIGQLVQTLDFVSGQGVNVSEQRGKVPHGDFAGLRHGAHSVDLSPDGRSLYIADIGRNCIWTYSIQHSQVKSEPPLKIGSKCICARERDGPRHTWPHPKGRILYCLQEHTSIVDIFSIEPNGTILSHRGGVKIIPHDKDPAAYWADEVRLSTGPAANEPKYLYASTRGLESSTKGYIAVFSLDEDGNFASKTAIHIWETPTSGGLANAIAPAPWTPNHETKHYLALTDSEQGLVLVLSFDGQKFTEEARLVLGHTEDGQPIGAATAVWPGSVATAPNGPVP